jgi:hypothetical protein
MEIDLMIKYNEQDFELYQQIETLKRLEANHLISFKEYYDSLLLIYDKYNIQYAK